MGPIWLPSHSPAVMNQPTDTADNLPPGVTPGLWQYVHRRQIADDYDDFFAFNRLFEFDAQVLARYVHGDGLVVDLGCGTGRSLLPLLRRGLRGLGIDLSQPMLQIAAQKAREEDLPLECVHANAVELDFLAENTADFVLCMFSTLGMIEGRDNRRRLLDHTRRILKPNGMFIVHVHNYWFNLTKRDDAWWLVKDFLRALSSRGHQKGDKVFEYRGIQDMYLHVFTLRELIGELRQTGFSPVEVIPLHPLRDRALRRPWLFGTLRCNGWIAVCR